MFAKDAGMLIEFVEPGFEKLSLGKRDRVPSPPAAVASPLASELNQLSIWPGRDMKTPEKSPKHFRKEQWSMERWLCLKGITNSLSTSQ